MKEFHQVAPGLQRVSLPPLDLVNVYILGDVLVDSGVRLGAPRLLKALEAHSIRAHAVTHAHFDHQGASLRVCQSLGIPLWCGEGDREAMETGDFSSVLPEPDARFWRLHQTLAGPPCPVRRVLTEGEEVGGFEVLETPGHTPGHLAFWRESDRTLVLGDVLFHRNPVTFRRGLQEPFRFATYDPSSNRRSARKLAALKPSLVCFGHGAPLENTDLFVDFVSRLPR